MNRGFCGYSRILCFDKSACTREKSAVCFLSASFCFGSAAQVGQLRSFQSCAELDVLRLLHLCQHMLERSDHPDGVEIIVVAEMGHAEELALHLSLSIGEYGSKAFAEFFYDRSGVESFRCEHRCDGCSGAGRGKQ